MNGLPVQMGNGLPIIPIAQPPAYGNGLPVPPPVLPSYNGDIVGNGNPVPVPLTGNGLPGPQTGVTSGPNGLPLVGSRPVDPGVFGLPHPAQAQTNTVVPAAASHANSGDIEHVIARFGIHPNSGLAHAMRAIHTALTAHLAAEAARIAHAVPHASTGGQMNHPGPALL